MSTPLPLPSADLAGRILSPCGYADRLPAGRFTSRLGIMRGTVRSLPELQRYLAPDDRSLPALSFDRLGDWMEHVIGDADLATATRAAAQAADNYVEGCLAIYKVVGERLDQARWVRGLAEPVAPGLAESAS